MAGMQDLAFKQQVAAHEQAWRRAPRRFTRRTLAMAWLGQAAIAGLLLLTAAGLAWSLWGLAAGRFQIWRLLAALGCAALLWSLLISLWTPRPALTGRAMNRREAPQLFALVDTLRRRTQAARIHEVVVNDGLGVGVLQHPWLGVLGWYRNTLVLGLPTLMAMDVKQLAALVVHELGHLSTGAGRQEAWLYRTRRNWAHLAQERSRPHFGTNLTGGLLKLFLQRFFPRFNARAWVLARQHEIAADELARSVAGPASLAEALVIQGVLGRYLAEVFWPRIWERAKREPLPMVTPLRAQHLLMRTSLTRDQIDPWLRDALKALPDEPDTHPSLRARLEATGAKPEWPQPATVCAAEELLGTELWDGLTNEMDMLWRDSHAGEWIARHQAQLLGERMLDELAQQDGDEPLPLADHLVWARTAWQVRDVAAALPLLREAAWRHPTSTEARFLLGQALLELAQPVLPVSRQPEPPPELTEGVALLLSLADETLDDAPETAFSTLVDPRWRLPAARLLETTMEQRQMFDALAEARALVRQRQREADAALDLLHEFDGEQRLAPSRLSPWVTRPLIDLLHREASVGCAWLLRKTHPWVSGWALHLLVIERSRVVGQPDSERWWQDLRTRIELPVELLVVDLAHPFWTHIARADMVQLFRASHDACIYRAKAIAAGPARAS